MSYQPQNPTQVNKKNIERLPNAINIREPELVLIELGEHISKKVTDVPKQIHNILLTDSCVKKYALLSVEGNFISRVNMMEYYKSRVYPNKKPDDVENELKAACAM